MKKAKASLMLALIMAMGPGTVISQIMEIRLPDNAKSVPEKVAYYQEYLDDTYLPEEIETILEKLTDENASQPEEEQNNILEK